MKKILLTLAIISFYTVANAQVKVNQNAANSAINTSSAFMDASSSPLWNGTTNQGKGMLYPRVDLVNYTAMSHAGPFNASNNPNYFDGLLVFNTATGIAGIAGNDGAAGATGLTGATGTNGLNALVNTTTEAAGSNCSNGGVKIEYGIDSNINGILDISEINATLTKYICNGLSTSGSGSGSSLIHGHVQYSNIGTLSSWVVPNGISLIEISIAGARGGDGGAYSNLGMMVWGGAGGNSAYVKLLAYCNAGDTIKYLNGANGLGGSYAGTGYTGVYSNAGNGTTGQTSYVYINNTLISTIYGGTGGSGTHWNSSFGSLIPGSPGTAGYIDMTTILDSGAFILNLNNDYNLNSSTILIRY